MADEVVGIILLAKNEMDNAIAAATSSVKSMVPALEEVAKKHHEHSEEVNHSTSLLGIFTNVLRSTATPGLMQFRGELGLLNTAFKDGKEVFNDAKEHLDTFGEIATVAVAGVAALVGAVAAATFELASMGAEEQEVMTHLQNFGNVGKESAESIAKAMNEVSEQTFYSRTALTSALADVSGKLELIQGHAVDATDATAFMAAASLKAEAANEGLASATSGLVTVMGAYHLSAGEATRTSAELYNIQRLTGMGSDEVATAVSRLQSRLGAATPDLATMGAIMAELTQVTGGSQRGMMVFDSAITTLTGHSKETEYAIKQLGLEVFDAQGQFVGFNELIPQLSEKLGELDPQSRQLAESYLFGSNAAGVMDKAISDLGDTLESKKSLIDDQRKLQDDAARSAEDFGHQVDYAKSQLANLADEAGGRIVLGLQGLISLFHAAAAEADKMAAAEGNAAMQAGNAALAIAEQQAGNAALAKSYRDAADHVDDMSKSIAQYQDQTDSLTDTTMFSKEHIDSMSKAIGDQEKAEESLAPKIGLVNQHFAEMPEHAAKAKTAMQELGLSLGELRKAMDILGFGADQQTQVLLAMGVKAEEAAPAIYGLTVSVLQLAAAFNKAGLDGAALAAQVEALQNQKKAADELKKSWSDLGVSASTMREAMNLLGISVGDQRDVLIKMGVDADKAGPVLKGLGVSADQLAEAFNRVGLNGAEVVARLQDIIDAKERAQKAVEAISGEASLNMAGALLGTASTGKDISTAMKDATDAMQSLAKAGRDTGTAFNVVQEAVERARAEVGQLHGAELARAGAVMDALDHLRGEYAAGEIGLDEYIAAMQKYEGELSTLLGDVDKQQDEIAKKTSERAKQVANDVGKALTAGLSLGDAIAAANRMQWQRDLQADAEQWAKWIADATARGDAAAVAELTKNAEATLGALKDASTKTLGEMNLEATAQIKDDMKKTLEDEGASAAKIFSDLVQNQLGPAWTRIGQTMKQAMDEYQKSIDEAKKKVDELVAVQNVLIQRQQEQSAQGELARQRAQEFEKGLSNGMGMEGIAKLAASLEGGLDSVGLNVFQGAIEQAIVSKFGIAEFQSHFQPRIGQDVLGLLGSFLPQDNVGEYTTGGSVPGPMGKPMAAIVHGGEYVLSGDMGASIIGLLQAILEKDSNTYLDGERISRNTSDYIMNNGSTAAQFGVGTYGS